MKLLNKLAIAFISGALAMGTGIAIVSSDKSNLMDASVKAAGVVNGDTITWTFGAKNDIGQNTDWHYIAGAPSGYEADRGVAWSKAATTIEYTTDVPITKVSLDASSNNPGYTLIVGGQSKSVSKSNHTTYEFDVSFAAGDTIVIETTKGSSVKSFWLKSITLTKGAASTVYATGIDLSIKDSTHTIDSDDTITLAKGSENGTAVVEFNVDVTPDNASDKGYTWTCDATDNHVITYDNEPDIAIDTNIVANYTLTVIATGSEVAGAVTKTVYIKIEDVYVPTVESVTVSGTPTKETQYVGADFDYSGLTFTANYDNGTTEVISGSDISWFALEAGENPTGVYSDVFVTVTSVTVVQGAFSDIAGIGGTTQYITATENNTTYYLKTNGSRAPLATTNKGEATAFTVTLVANDTYQFENDGKYLYCTAANDGVRFGSSTNVNWIVTGPTANKTGSYTVMNTATNRYLSLYNLQDFRSYTSATASNRHVNTDFESFVAISGLTINVAAGAQTRFLKDSTFDPVTAGYSAVLNYSNGDTEDVTSEATWTLDTSTVTNSAVITASYGGQTDSIENITIYEVVATKLFFNLSNMKISYATGETLNTEGLVIMGLDDNDQVVIDSCDLSDCTFTPTVLSTAGTQTITVVYTNTNGQTATGTFEVTVADELMYIKVTSVDDITFGDSYILGVENNNKKDILMSGVTGSNKYIDGVQSTALTTDLNGVKAGELENTVHPITLVKADEDGIAMFDLVTNKFIEGNTGNYAYLKDAYTGNCKWEFSFENDHLNITWAVNTERVFGYNVGSPRFSTYKGYANYNYNMASGTAHLVLYKLAGSSVKNSVESFNTGSLLMNQYVGDNSYNRDRCIDNYSEMKSEFVLLSEVERMLFLDGTTFADAYARFDAWCIANHEEYSMLENSFSLRQSSRFTVIADSSTTTIVVICSLLTLSTIAVYFSVRKKKEI